MKFAPTASAGMPARTADNRAKKRLIRVLLNLRVRLDLVTPDVVTEIVFRYFLELQWVRPLAPSLLLPVRR